MVTGGESMMGRAICTQLKMAGHKLDPVPHGECDLMQESQVVSRFEEFRPDYVIHAAGYNGGIAWNQKYPEKIFRRTVRMGLNVLESCSLFDVKRTVSIISSCAYPDLGEKPLQESDFWNGLPNPSVECHGLAKRMLHAYSRQLNKQGSCGEYLCAVVNNSYGPWDSFHPLKTKVVAALIKKFVEAKENSLPQVHCWGTGAPLREFIYAEDAAAGIIVALGSWDMERGDIVNITGHETSIKGLTEMIAELVGYEGEVIWDTDKPDGQMRKSLDATEINKLSFQVYYSLKAGLQKTIDWYVENKKMADERCNL